MGPLDFLFPRDLETTDRALNCRVRGGATPLMVVSDLWEKHLKPCLFPGDPYIPLRKLTASVLVSEAKEVCVG